MDERDAEYRASSDRLLETLSRLRDVESTKRSVPVGDPEFVRMAAEAADLGRRVFRWSQVEQQLAQTAPAARARGEVSGRSLDQIEPRPLSRVLAEWREAEFRFRDALPGSQEAEWAAADMERLRSEYREIGRLKQQRSEAASADRPRPD